MSEYRHYRVTRLCIVAVTSQPIAARSREEALLIFDEEADLETRLRDAVREHMIDGHEFTEEYDGAYVDEVAENGQMLDEDTDGYSEEEIDEILLAGLDNDGEPGPPHDED